MGRLRQKVSIITGAGSGVGRGIALRFAEEGSKVVVADISPAAGQDTVAVISAAGGRAIYAKADVSNAAEVRQMVQQTVEAFGGLHILVNNAGIFTLETQKLAELPEDVWDKVIDVNLKGSFLCSKYAIPEIIKGGGGSVINISSLAGTMVSMRGAYGASKAGLIALAKTIALQYAEQNIRANTICAGAVDTPARSEARQGGFYGKNLIGRMVQRVGTPEDIANAAVFLASDEASYITAATLNVDGGATGLSKAADSNS